MVALPMLAGCEGSTTLLVELVDGSGTSQASSAEVRVFGAHGVIAGKTVDPLVLPGALVVRKLPARSEDLRVVVIAAGASRTVAAASATTRAHERVTVTVDVSVAMGDADGDGVPDAFDDCPQLADPDQVSTQGGQPGDACGGSAPDMAATGDQGSGGDLALPPGPTADLSTGPSPDLAMGVDPNLLLDDPFDTLDGSRWLVSTGNGGSASVKNGVLTLRAPATANAWAEIASRQVFGVGTTFTAQVHWSGGQVYDEKAVGYSNARLSDNCQSGDSESATMRGQNVDLLMVTKHAGSQLCQIFPNQPSGTYPAGDRTFQVERLNGSQVDFSDNGGSSSTAQTFYIPADALPVRLGVFTSSVNPSQNDVVMTVDWVKVRQN
jgi:hypothetical protein